MADISAGSAPLALPAGTRLGARLAAWKAAYADYRRRRAIYLRTLRELRSYRPHELADLRIQTDDIDSLAQRQAGF